MVEKNLPISNDDEQEQLLLKAQMKLLQQELDAVGKKTSDFEAILRSHLMSELVEEQELTVLYKKLQQAKKEKRFAQKKKGKNFKEVTGLKVIAKNNTNSVGEHEQKEKKTVVQRSYVLCTS